MKLNYCNVIRIGFALFLTFTAAVSYAEPNVMKCTFFLEEFEVNDFSNKPGCPSGSEGIGNPWRTDTYEFDFKSFPKHYAFGVKINTSSCSGNSISTYGYIKVNPKYITIYYRGSFAHNGHDLTINRETLMGIDGEKCEQTEGESLIISSIKTKN